MAVFSITYVLHSNESELGLKNGIHAVSFGVWIKPVPSQFIVQSSLTADQILNTLKTYTYAKDALFVSKLDQPHWSSININTELMGELKRRFF